MSDFPTPAHDFTQLLDLTIPELLRDLAYTHSQIANYAEEIAWLRVQHIQSGAKGSHPEIVKQEAKRDVLIERKFLLARVLDVRLRG